MKNRYIKKNTDFTSDVTDNSSHDGIYDAVDDKSFASSLQIIYKATSYAKSHYAGMSVGALNALVYIMINEGRIEKNKLSIKHMAEEMSIPYPTMARHIDLLGDGISGKDGLGFVFKFYILPNRKEKYIGMTDRGRQFLNTMISLSSTEKIIESAPQLVDQGMAKVLFQPK